MKKIFKLSLTLILMFSVLIGIVTFTSDASYSEKMGTLISESEGYSDSTGTTDKVNSITGTVITVIRIIGVAVAIVMLLVVAMKYMTAAPGDKADIKKSAVQYVVGAIVLFAVTGLLGIISKFSSAIK